MDISEWFKSLVVDTWYKVFVCAGAGLFVLALCVDVKGMSNGQLQLLSGGLFFLGIGVWKNEKIASWFKPPNVYTGPSALISTEIRQPDPVGRFFELLNATLILAFAISIMSGSSRKTPQQPTTSVGKPISAAASR